MADIFLQQDVRQLLFGKTIYYIGDSNMRGAYKDLVQLSGRNSLLPTTALKSRLEQSFNGDYLVFHGPQSNGRSYREEREYKHDGFEARFYFLTRCYSEYVEHIFSQMEHPHLQPDVIVYNSCLWDVSRWGPNGVDKYKENIVILLKRLTEILPPKCLFIWTTTMPLSQKINGGFLIKQVEFLRHTLRFDVMEANLFTATKVAESGFDVLDLHYHLKWQIHRRAKDGVHWLPHVVRHITNLILTHISLAWNRPLPGRLKSNTLTGIINTRNERVTADSDSIESESESDEGASTDENRNSDQDCRSDWQEDQFSYPTQPIAQLQVQDPNRGYEFSRPMMVTNNQHPDRFRFGDPCDGNFERFEAPVQNLPVQNFQDNAGRCDGQWPGRDTRRVIVRQPCDVFQVFPNAFEQLHNGFQEFPYTFDQRLGERCQEYPNDFEQNPRVGYEEFPNMFNAMPEPRQDPKGTQRSAKRKRHAKSRRGKSNSKMRW